MRGAFHAEPSPQRASNRNRSGSAREGGDVGCRTRSPWENTRASGAAGPAAQAREYIPSLSSVHGETYVRALKLGKETNVGLILFLVVLVLLFGGGGFYMGAPYHMYGGGLSLIVVIVIVVLLLRG